MKPLLTPLQAVTLLRVQDPINLAGHQYMLDGPMGTPSEFLAPHVTDLSDPRCEWYCTGEPGDPVTEATEWLAVVDGVIQDGL